MQRDKKTKPFIIKPSIDPMVEFNNTELYVVEYIYIEPCPVKTCLFKVRTTQTNAVWQDMRRNSLSEICKDLCKFQKVNFACAE